MRRTTAVACLIALVSTACSVEPLADPGLGGAPLTTTVLAADGSVIALWHGDQDRIPVAYADLPQNLVDAVVAIEDRRFWTHQGLDVRAVARAANENLAAGGVVQGGSTITQQYIKTVALDPSVSLDRKIEEANMALALEQELSKQEILERYLNVIYFGHGAYGVGAAARRYFGKSVQELTLDESALLAGIIRAPSTLDPFVDPEAALERRNLVLSVMLELEWINQAEHDTAADTPLRLVAETGISPTYPYFTEEVRARLLADPALGETPEERLDLLLNGGLTIYTTLDPTAQASAEAAIRSIVPDNGPSAALVAIDPRTGAVRAMVGGRDWYDPDDPVAKFNLATKGRRQAGSAFKPFTLAAALQAGVELDHVYGGGDDVEILTDSGPWEVTNFDSARYPGLDIAEATVFSVNVVFAQVIAQIGPQAVVDTARAAGITTALEPYHSLALGAQEVSVLDMASAYATFAASGIHIDPIFVTSITDPTGEVIWEAVPVLTQAIDADVADEVTRILHQVVIRGTGQQAKIGRDLAGKTGTSEDNGDAWFVGYTPELAAAVWVGFPEAVVPMEYPATPFTITGGTWPAQIFGRFAIGALSGVPYGQLPTTDGSGLIAIEVDLSTGFLAGPLCPRSHVARVQVDPENAPTVICPIHNTGTLGAVGSGTVPDVTQLDLDTAVFHVEAAGYTVRLEWEASSPLPHGTVFAQAPDPSVPAQAGSPVTLTVAGAEPGTVVPEVLGLPAAEALTSLSSLDVEVVDIVEAEPVASDAEARSGRVWAQSPPPGAALTDVVTIWINP